MRGNGISRYKINSLFFARAKSVRMAAAFVLAANLAYYGWLKRRDMPL